MNKNIVYVFIGIIAIVAISLYFQGVKNRSNEIDTEKNQETNTNSQLTPTEEKTPEKVDETTEKAQENGRYISYDSKELTSMQNVIFFAASWCPTCRALDKELVNSKKQIPDNLTILKADFDTEKELRKKYGVTLQHTLVQVDSNGNLITKWSSSRDLTEILEEVIN